MGWDAQPTCRCGQRRRGCDRARGSLYSSRGRLPTKRRAAPPRSQQRRSRRRRCVVIGRCSCPQNGKPMRAVSEPPPTRTNGRSRRLGRCVVRAGWVAATPPATRRLFAPTRETPEPAKRAARAGTALAAWRSPWPASTPALADDGRALRCSAGALERLRGDRPGAHRRDRAAGAVGPDADGGGEVASVPAGPWAVVRTNLEGVTKRPKPDVAPPPPGWRGSAPSTLTCNHPRFRARKGNIHQRSRAR